MTENKPAFYNRKSLRLKHHDYSSPGFYFITVCIADRQCLLGNIIETELNPARMIKNPYAGIVEHAWFDLVNHVANIQLHEFVVMPNHVHGIIQIQPAMLDAVAAVDISEIIRQFKTFSARRINQLRNTKGRPVWQRNYYEHVIRNEFAHAKITEYINTNPLRWKQDVYYGD